MRSRSPSSSQPTAEPRPRPWGELTLSLVAWSVAGGVVFAAFMAAPVRDVYVEHFRSWHVSSMPSSTGLARFWRAAEPWLIGFTLASSVISGALGVVRASYGKVATLILRFPVAYGMSLVVEWSAVGVQDGSAGDVDFVPTHSLIILVVCLLVPWAFAGYDWWRMSTGDDR